MNNVVIKSVFTSQYSSHKKNSHLPNIGIGLTFSDNVIQLVKASVSLRPQDSLEQVQVCKCVRTNQGPAYEARHLVNMYLISSWVWWQYCCRPTKFMMDFIYWSKHKTVKNEMNTMYLIQFCFRTLPESVVMSTYSSQFRMKQKGHNYHLWIKWYLYFLKCLNKKKFQRCISFHHQKCSDSSRVRQTCKSYAKCAKHTPQSHGKRLNQ